MSDDRPPWPDIILGFAVQLARRSTCARLKVGCVMVTPDHRQILAGGYNGGAKGLENDCESPVPGQCGHLHAEINACIKAPADVPKLVYVTNLPCAMCAKALINLGGVQEVIFKETYRDVTGLTLLNRAGIKWSHRLRIESDAVGEALTASQARCIQLLEENRRLRDGNGS